MRSAVTSHMLPKRPSRDIETPILQPVSHLVIRAIQQRLFNGVDEFLNHLLF